MQNSIYLEAAPLEVFGARSPGGRKVTPSAGSCKEINKTIAINADIFIFFKVQNSKKHLRESRR
jgi:hypothetical protein